MSFNAVGDALLACLFTYFLTAFGALGVYVFDTYGNTNQTAAVMATAVGLMLSAVMDLLQECLAVSEEALGVYAWVPVAVGVVAACVVLVGLDHAFAGAEEPAPAPRAPVVTQPPPLPAPVAGAVLTPYRDDPADSDHGAFDSTDGVELTIHTSGNTLRDRSGRSAASATTGGRGAAASDTIDGPTAAETRKAWLLFFALTVQHIPEALAMGVAFADADGSGRWGASFSVTLAIGLQDIPEGLAAALVLRQLGMSKWKSFLFGQATGMVQPVSGVLGALAVIAVRAALPYALAFAGACMLFVVVKDMLPDCMKGEDRTLPTLMVMVGFAVMLIATVLINSLQM